MQDLTDTGITEASLRAFVAHLEAKGPVLQVGPNCRIHGDPAALLIPFANVIPGGYWLEKDD